MKILIGLAILLFAACGGPRYVGKGISVAQRSTSTVNDTIIEFICLPTGIPPKRSQ